MEQDKLIVKGARVHNLKNIDVEIPRDRLVVITGLSGSGKSSLAFDTIYAEGQRRYVESLSAYARQFLGLMERPDVDYIEGLSPAISIEQKTISHNPRSTVGTVTEIYDYLRLLFARAGKQFCYKCGRPVERQTVDQIIDAVMNYPKDSKLQILAPIIRGRKGHYRELFEEILKDGFLRVRVDGVVKELRKGMQTERYKIHNIEVMVDRIVMGNEMRARVADSIETALAVGSGMVIIHDGTSEQLFSQLLSCKNCGISYEEPAPNSFSFNSPYGSCPACNGLGETRELDVNMMLPDDSLTINEEALAAFGKPRSTWLWSQVRAVAKRYSFDFDTPMNALSKKAVDVLLHGGGDEQFDVNYTYASGRSVVYKHRFDGMFEIVKRQFAEATTSAVREWAESFMVATPCEECKGGRLRKESLAVRLVDVHAGISKNIDEVVRLSIGASLEYFRALEFAPREQTIAAQILKEIRERLSFLVNVGLDYLTLARSARSLSGGEAQRIRLATQIGSQLVGVLYILDEPSIGLHQRDNLQLIDSLKHLRDLGNTVIVVEHDKEMIESADYVVDLGPGAGEHGGHVVMEAAPADLARKPAGRKNKSSSSDSRSFTARYLRGEALIETPATRRKGNGKSMKLKGCKGHNLKDVTLSLPLGTFIVISGVSGSGKSSLISETLYPVLARKFYKSRLVPLPYTNVTGLEHIDKVIEIDQSPIGRTPRSNPATYTGLFTFIRDLFTQLPEAKIRGYQPGRFSFNVEGGRCEECEGDGVRKIEMNFLPDVYVSCEVCKGRRYNRQTLEILFKGKSISDVLEMTVEEAVEFFKDIPRIRRKLETLHDVGLGYIRLGQQATTLSGGEAQRVKLSTELSKVGTGNTLYILDEPTTGLHFEDIRMLLSVLGKLVDKGNSVLVIEHNMDVIRTADWIIDLGPEGGDRGGVIVAEGTPEDVAKAPGSYTAEFLRRELTGTARRAF